MIHDAELEFGTSQMDALEMVLRILRGAIAAEASDIHLRAGQPPLVRLQGELRPLDHPVLEATIVAKAFRSLASWADVSPERLDRLQLEFGCTVPELGRFRVHAYRQMGSRAMVMRHVPMPVPSFAQLRLPPVIKPISMETRGLVLVTGATGNGKSTTIASMLEFMNQNSCRHVVTIEDPVEFVFNEGRSSFSQREVGIDVDSHRDGLKGALREDPDVVFVGEIRTAEEFDVALNAAEAGHLVVSTLHSTDVSAAIQRMIGFYPSEMESIARSRIADALTAVVAQKLLPSRAYGGRVLVTEVLRKNATITDCVRDPARFRGLSAALDNAFHEIGSHSFDHQLLGMVRAGTISLDTARAAARSEKDLVRQIKLAR